MKTLNTLKPYLAQWRILEVTLLEDSELCEELDIHPVTSSRWRRNGSISYLKIKRKVYYRMSDVLWFLSRKSEVGSPKKNQR